jgi:DNA repair protein RadC
MYIREMRVSYGRRLPVERQTLNIKNAREIVAVMAPVLEKEVVEVCYVLCLTTKTGLIRYHQLSRGGVSTTLVHPREVYQAALMANAACIVLIHNHPSGDPAPSPDDLAVTQRVRDAGEVIGIELLDHVIVARGGRYVSIKEMGRFG